MASGTASTTAGRASRLVAARAEERERAHDGAPWGLSGEDRGAQDAGGHEERRGAEQEPHERPVDLTWGDRSHVE